MGMNKRTGAGLMFLSSGSFQTEQHNPEGSSTYIVHTYRLFRVPT